MVLASFAFDDDGDFVGVNDADFFYVFASLFKTTALFKRLARRERHLQVLPRLESTDAD